MSLPVYQPQAQAYQSGIAVLAPYLDNRTLDVLARVNKQFFTIFGGYLWSDPIRILSRSSRPFTKTIQFLTRDHDVLFRALVQALDFRPLVTLRNSNSYLRDLKRCEQFFNCQFFFGFLTSFKNLKFVAMDGVHIWNHHDYDITDDFPRFNTKILLLSASGSLKLDASTFLNKDTFTNLMFLDISWTDHASDTISTLNNYQFNNLRVLKMRNMRLTKLPRFILIVGLGLWSLDLRSNFLTDDDIDALLLHCFKDPILRPGPLPLPVSDANFFEYPPEYSEHDDTQDDIPARRPDNATLFMEAMMNAGKTVSNPIYSLTGLTQLYIADNKFTARGTGALLGSTNRLQVLDVGAVLSNIEIRIQGATHSTIFHAHEPILMPPSQLERIRVHHSFVTLVPTITLGSQMKYHIPYIKAAEQFAAGYPTDTNTSYDPLQNHRITHLILTDIPTKSYGILIDHLVALLRKVTRQIQDIEQVRTSSLTTRSHRAATLLPGLRLLRLEFLNDDGRSEPSTSVSGEKDAETFLERSMGDFSFFGGELGRGKKEKKGNGKGKGQENEGEERVLRDVVAEIKAFREKELPRWPGQLQLVLP
ncbi:hypothetical protein VTL71DRAFT_828 [Oculimacula yallundae]|uniref:Uncharacterized protein n=1 Tax=Oculimacula yallundae TaxID=86028 RepID=A0ABR4D198_9HELO